MEIGKELLTLNTNLLRNPNVNPENGVALQKQKCIINEENMNLTRSQSFNVSPHKLGPQTLLNTFVWSSLNIWNYL